jgi:hypothetical protein
MKRIIISLILMTISLGAWAQYAGTGTIKRVGSHIEMNGEKLSPEAQSTLLSNIGGQDYYADWEKARKGRSTGMGLTIGGGSAVVVGGAALVVGLTASAVGAATGGIVGSIGGQESAQQAAEEGAKAGDPIITGGLIASALGVAAMGAGIPKIVKNVKKLNGIVNTYNNGGQPSAQVSFGATGNGIGLALRF